ncbi:MAG TPA: DUF4350 domain-containing protein [Xanthobacteraceae bacterium]
MKAPGNFPPRVLAAWLAAAILLAIATVLLGIFGGSTNTVGPSTFSRSAIGYAGIADVMRRLGARVVKSRTNSIGNLNSDGLLVVAEPSPDVAPQQLRVLFGADRVLLILPKWIGLPSQSPPGWVSQVAPLPESVAQAAARSALQGVDIVSTEAVTRWSHNEIGSIPVIAGNVQLIKSSRLRAVVGTDSGMLVGELRIGPRRMWILADPDVMQNHGLGEPDNAVFSVALINALRGADGNVVFDEVVHGFESAAGSPLRLLFEFPFWLATLQGAVAVALLLWATLRRFGAPVSPPVALQSGKRNLIENTAKLLERAGLRPVIVQRYVHATVQEVARQLHAPAGISESALVEWLRRSGRARAVEVDCGALLSEADSWSQGGRPGTARPAALARDIFRWKREIIDGIPGHSRIDRSDSQRGRQGGRRAG